MKKIRGKTKKIATTSVRTLAAQFLLVGAMGVVHANPVNTTSPVSIGRMTSHSNTKEVVSPPMAGHVSLHFSSPLPWSNPGTACSNNAVYIAPGDNHLISMAVLAKTSGKRVHLYAEPDAGLLAGNCYLRALEIEE